MRRSTTYCVSCRHSVFLTWFLCRCAWTSKGRYYKYCVTLSVFWPRIRCYRIWMYLRSLYSWFCSLLYNCWYIFVYGCRTLCNHNNFDVRVLLYCFLKKTNNEWFGLKWRRNAMWIKSDIHVHTLKSLFF